MATIYQTTIDAAAATGIDPQSGFCPSTSTFHSKRHPLPLLLNPYLDVVTFISSQPHHGKTAFIDAATGQHLSFTELWTSVASVSTALTNMGVRKGHVILILSPNSILFPIICLSIVSLGAIITTTNPLNTSNEIAKQIKDSKASLAFTVSSLLPKLYQADSSLPIVLIDPENFNSDSNSKYLVKMTLTEMLKSKPSESRVAARICQDDIATLLYSSGTTGTSKGVISSHRNLIAMVQTIVTRFKSNSFGEQRFICTVPMFHIYGLASFAMGLLASGTTIIVLSKFEFHELLSSIQRYKATDLPLVPPILVALVNAADQIKSKYNFSSIETVISGGAPLCKEVIEGFVDKYPWIKILQGYGLTESTGIGASTDTLEESRRYGTAGKLSPSMEARIIDPESGRALGVNMTGELCLRGPSIMKGYFSNEEATSTTIDSKGWLKTGDLCYIDEDGFIFIVDRLKELIKYKGYQVAPAELEALLLTHPGVSDAAVIPFPDKLCGQYPAAYVVRKERSNLSEAGIKDFVAKQVASYKRIRKVTFIPAIPKNASGKILRKDLIELATSKL